MLINLRNALMAGKRLPYDAEVEYLQSSGIQYIDTLVNADSNLSVEITMANIGTPWTNVNPGGAILATPRCRHHINFESFINYYFGNGDNCSVNSEYRPTDGEIVTYKVDATSKTFTLGSFLGTFPNDTFDTGLSYWLFGRNGTTPPYLGSFRIFSAKLWNGNTLVRDYIPVRKGTVGYLYDRVTRKLFGNAGTGDFVLGPDVVPVEYIESHGTEWIDTGILPTSSDRFTGSFSYVGSAPDGHQYLAGANATTTGNVLMRLISSGAFNISGFGQASISLGTYTNTLSGFVVASEDFSYNGTTSSASWTSGMSIDRSLYLFARHAIITANKTSGMRIGSFCIERNDVKIIDLLPVRVGTEGAMMDVLTRRIYRNAGTGAFSYGNDLKYPIPAE